MTIVLSLVLIVGAGLFVAWPFVVPAPSTAGGGRAADELSPLERQKLDAYAALKEAEFDWRMGKLSETDFAALNEKYRQQALAAIAAIEDARGRARRERGKVPGTRSPRRIAFCPSCGERVPARANFCGGCGRSLRELVA